MDLCICSAGRGWVRRRRKQDATGKERNAGGGVHNCQSEICLSSLLFFGSARLVFSPGEELTVHFINNNHQPVAPVV